MVCFFPKLFSFLDAWLQLHSYVYFFRIVEEDLELLFVLSVLNHCKVWVFIGAPRTCSPLQEGFRQGHISFGKSIVERGVTFVALVVAVDSDIQDGQCYFGLVVVGCIAERGFTIDVHLKYKLPVVAEEGIDGGKISILYIFKEGV